MKKYDNSVNNLRTVDSSHMTSYTYEELRRLDPLLLGWSYTRIV